MDDRIQKALDLDDDAFKRLIGVKKQTFQKMLQVLEDKYLAEHKRGGKPAKKMPPGVRLLVALQYWREYRDMEHIGYDFNVVKSAVCDAVQWVEDTLIADGTFQLPGKKALLGTSQEISCVVIDVTESSIERPKHGQKAYYSGKKNGIP